MTSEAKDRVTQVLSSMLLDELILDVALEEHTAALRRRTPCEICGGSCNSTSCPAPATSREQQPGSRAPSPGPSNGLKGECYYDCLNCKKPQAASRYAPHLSKCLGLTGRGRTSTRAAAAASSTNGHGSSSVPPRSASPYVTSDDNDSSYGSTKKKKAATDAAKNGMRRTASPAPGKYAKKPSSSQPISNLNPASQALAKSASLSALPSKHATAPFSTSSTVPSRTSTPTLPPQQAARKHPHTALASSAIPPQRSTGPGLDPPSSSEEEEVSESEESDVEAAAKKKRKVGHHHQQQQQQQQQMPGQVARKAPVTSMPQQAYAISSGDEA